MLVQDGTLNILDKNDISRYHTEYLMSPVIDFPRVIDGYVLKFYYYYYMLQKIFSDLTVIQWKKKIPEKSY